MVSQIESQQVQVLIMIGISDTLQLHGNTGSCKPVCAVAQVQALCYCSINFVTIGGVASPFMSCVMALQFVTFS